MSRTPVVQSVEEQALSEIRAEIREIATALAAEHGPAMGSDSVSDEQAVRLWGIRDPKVDPDALVMDLMDGGLDPALAESLKVVQENPDLAPLYGPQADGRPFDSKMADLLTRLAEFPFRLNLLRDLEDDPEEMVALANRLDRQWQKRMAEQGPPAVFDDRADGLGPAPDATGGMAAPTPLTPPAQAPSGYQTVPSAGRGMPADPMSEMGG